MRHGLVSRGTDPEFKPNESHALARPRRGGPRPCWFASSPGRFNRPGTPSPDTRASGFGRSPRGGKHQSVVHTAEMGVRSVGPKPFTHEILAAPLPSPASWAELVPYHTSPKSLAPGGGEPPTTTANCLHAFLDRRRRHAVIDCSRAGKGGIRAATRKSAPSAKKGSTASGDGNEADRRFASRRAPNPARRFPSAPGGGPPISGDGRAREWTAERLTPPAAAPSAEHPFHPPSEECRSNDHWHRKHDRDTPPTCWTYSSRPCRSSR